MKITIQETERGFLYDKGRFVRLLQPGVHRVPGRAIVRRAVLTKPLSELFSEEELLLFAENADFQEETVTQLVPDGQMAVHYVDGRFAGGLPAGRHVFWKAHREHTFTLFALEGACTELPAEICVKLCTSHFMVRYIVKDYQKGLLYIDGKLAGVLGPGAYYYWRNGAVSYELECVETRLQELALNGQEILTKDRVGVRLNFVCSYVLTDPVKACTEIEDHEAQFYTAVQLTVREYVAAVTLDELLLDRERMGEALLTALQPKAQALCIRVESAGIRDIILPGEVRDIMNTVLLAEKRAQANVITRREEVASTRSLLNTARLMDENRTLYKLKELEYLEKICENVGNISVSGGDLLGHLRAIIGSEGDK
ncbi:MAG: slipin family protein [Oscillospiraceae bacterium]|nr:slipin family protein [Oscillospiraceae bacterium]